MQSCTNFLSQNLVSLMISNLSSPMVLVYHFNGCELLTLGSYVDLFSAFSFQLTLPLKVNYHKRKQNQVVLPVWSLFY